jgi:hypothetical protein
MARFLKNKQQLGFRTPEHFRERLSVPKIPFRQKIRYTQHKG